MPRAAVPQDHKTSEKDSLKDHSQRQDVGDNVGEYFREDHSRTFVKDKFYVLPVDQDEVKRSEIHHRLCQFLFSGRNYVGPVKEALQFGQRRRILDLGTGSGAWAIDMADEFPRAEVLAIDLAPIQPRQVPPNCIFELCDLNEIPTPYPDAYFDFIHARSLHIGITRYPRLLREIARLLRPGGLTLLIEPTLDPFPSSDPSMTGWHDFWKTYRACLRKNGIDTTVPERLSELLANTDAFEAIIVQDGNIPVGFWPEDPHLLSVGQLQWMDYDLLLPALQPFFLSSGLPPSSVERLIKDAQGDLYHPSCGTTFAKLHIAYATKRHLSKPR